MSFSKKIRTILPVVLLMIFATFNLANAKTFKIKIATWYADGHPQIESLKLFKEIVEKESNKGIKVEIYPSSQLGSEEVFIDSVKRGTIEMGVPGIMTSKDLPKIAIAEMPFLFDGWEHAKKVFLGSIGKEIADGYLEASGARVLGWTVNGFREISSNRLVASYSDLENLRLRVPGVEYYIKMAEGFGSNPTPMAFSELFNALETKVVDGQDNPYPTVRASGMWEVQPFLLESRHIFSPNLWIINDRFFNKLPAEFQELVQKAAVQAIAYNWDLSIKKDTEDAEWLKSQGLTITLPSEEFKEKLKNSQTQVYEWFYKNYPGTKELAYKIRAIK